VALLDDLMRFSSPHAATAVGIFVIGHILGTVLLGLALVRSRAVPVVVGALLVVSQPLHLVAYVIVQSWALDAAAYGLTALGLGAAGIAYYRQARP
jgi:hypothetical protein